ncbi:MAG: substrate-binding domain-containing protein [Pseudomonadota bacterium]
MAKCQETITCTVKQYRLAKGWSQEDLADRLAIRRQAVYDIESGRYLPNTAIALRLASLFGCRVEDLFVDGQSSKPHTLHMINGTPEPSCRLVLGRVRNRLVGIPLSGSEALSTGFRSANGFLDQDGKNAQFLSSPECIDKSVILMGCDPAFQILGDHVSRISSDVSIMCRFASSHRALDGLAKGLTHVAGTHLHNTGSGEANVDAVRRKLGGSQVKVLGFSLLEEGLMIARGNPLGIRTVFDLAQPGIRFVNREPGAALRVLLDDLRQRSGIPESAITGYDSTVASHREGAWHILCGVADAALGLKAVAEAYNLGFVPLASVRCDMVIPEDLMTHAGVSILLDVLQSGGLRKEIGTLPGYGNSVTGNTISTH